ISTGGLRLDEAVAVQVLEAVQPVGVTAALEAVTLASRIELDKQTALSLALEKARHEADRLHRQFDAVDPGNRLVAVELESRRDEMSRLQTELTSVERQRLLDLGADLKAMWIDPRAPISLKKRLVRTVLEEIVLDVLEVDPPKLHLRLHWVGGVHTELLIAKNRTGQTRRVASQDTLELIRELAKVCRDSKIAAILNRLGLRTGSGNVWKQSRVASLRQHHQIPICAVSGERAWLTLAEAAAQLGVSVTVVRRLLREKVLPANQVVACAPYIIERESLILPAVQEAVRAILSGQRRLRTAPGQLELPFN